MKNSHNQSKLNLEKLKITKLKNPNQIKGGGAPGAGCGNGPNSSNTDTHPG